MRTTNINTTTMVIGGAVAAAVIGVIVLVATRGDDDNVKDDDQAAEVTGPVGIRDPAAATRDQKLQQRLDAIDQRLDQIAKAAPPSPSPSRPTRPTPDPDAVYAVPVAGDPYKGPADALVTVVRGGEYACPFCEKVRPALDQLVREYPDTVRIVYKDFIVHPDKATEPAKAACAAYQQGKFWEMDELIWDKAYKTKDFSAANLADLARDAGLDMRRYRNDLDACTAEIQADMETLRRFGVGGTPAFFINGRYLSGAQPYDRFKVLVDEELAKARDRIAQGTTSASQYYTVFVVAKGLDRFTTAPPLAEAPPP